MKSLLIVLLAAMMPFATSVGQAYDSCHNSRGNQQEVAEKIRQLEHLRIVDAVTDKELLYKQRKIDSLKADKIAPPYDNQ